MKKLDFIPLNNYVVVEVPVIDEKTASGIIKAESQIEEEKTEGHNYFKVIAVANDIKDVKVGDEVIMNTMQLRGFVYNKHDYGLIGYQHLIAVKPKK